MQRDDCKYAPFYCEENIWHLCADVPGDRRQVVFISNPAREVLMFRQRGFREAAVWDYHVVLLVDGSVYDLDSSLPFPCPLKEYLEKSFIGAIHAAAKPCFRLIDADEFVRTFASDRGHMLDANGSYLQPPPPWPAIHPERGSNLMQFADMQTPFCGEVLSLAAMLS